jgi:hypothetical protein
VSKLPHEIVTNWLNHMNGWWRLWFVILLVMICLGAYEGLQDRSAYYPKFRTLWCIPGTLDSEIVFNDYSTESAMYWSCVSVGDFIIHVLKRAMPILAIIPVMFITLWVRRGFNGELS